MTWYASGLKFSCTSCGNCCTGEPGFTWVSDGEVVALAQRLGLDETAFRRRYTVQVHRQGKVLTSIVEKPGGACIFYHKGSGCTVYDDRPRQCRTWPFWKRVVASPEAWADEALRCPGMNTGAHHEAHSVIKTAANDGLPL